MEYEIKTKYHRDKIKEETNAWEFKLSEDEIGLAEAQREKICGSKYFFRFKQAFEEKMKREDRARRLAEGSS